MEQIVAMVRQCRFEKRGECVVNLLRQDEHVLKDAIVKYGLLVELGGWLNESRAAENEDLLRDL